jgi:hypothetical protein
MCQLESALHDLPANSPVLLQASGIPAFFVGFVLTPLASNASELLSSLKFAGRKQQRNASLTFAQVALMRLICLHYSAVQCAGGSRAHTLHCTSASWWHSCLEAEPFAWLALQVYGAVSPASATQSIRIIALPGPAACHSTASCCATSAREAACLVLSPGARFCVIYPLGCRSQ